MKKIILLILPILFLASACGDDDSITPTDTLSATINSQGFSTELVAATISNVFGSNLFVLVGVVELSNMEVEKIAISFILPAGESPTAQTYLSDFGEDCLTSNTICAAISYGIGTEDDDLDFNSVNTTDANGEIEITAIDYTSGGYVIGTFSGNLKNEDGEGVTITNGSFSLSIE